MPHLEQFEVWIFQNNRWELAAAFFDVDTAAAVASNRKMRVKLVHAIYDNGHLVSQEIIAEIGDLRSE